MDDNHRYRPYYRTNRRYDDDNYKHQYKKPNKHRYQYSSPSSRRENRNYNDLSYRRSYRNDYHYQHPQTKSKSYSYFSSPPPPLMSTQIPPPPPPPSSLTVVPHERESWIRSVKKTKTNESTEQKTQYLETMLRMPQQKSLLNSSRFDRMRFADDQLSTTTTTNTTILNNDNFDNSSFHLIGDINNHDDICTLEKILFDNELKQQQKTPDDSINHQSLPTPPQSIIESESILQKNCSGFLIDNCEEEVELPPLSPPSRPLLPPLTSDELIQPNDEDNNQRRVMLVSELDAADAERKQELKRQKRLHQKLKQKKKETNIEKQITDLTIHNNEQESISDWIIEYDVNQVSQLTDEVRRASLTMTNEDKTEKVNLILMKIKKQQEELRKLRQYVMSMLGEQQKPKSSNLNRENSNITHDLLMAFLNQPTNSGCWLCSGKMYAEVATQCDDDDDDEQ